MGEQNDDPIEALRGRIHRMADVVQSHDNKLLEHSIEHRHLKEGLDVLREDKASRHELKGLGDGLQQALTSQTRELTMQLNFVKDGQAAMQKWISWGVALVLAGVILAGLNLVIRHDGQQGDLQPSIESPAHVR